MMFSTFDDYIQERRKKYLDELKEIYANANLSLLLGAGVSYDYNNGVSWEKLVLSLFKRKFAAKYSYYTTEEFVWPPEQCAKDYCTDRKSSLLDIAEYISPSHPQGVSKLIIADRNSQFSAILASNILSSAGSDLSKKDTVLFALARLAFDDSTGRIKVRHIITYNYDDYMEAALLIQTKKWSSTVNVAEINEENTLSPFYYRESKENCISVYHVHGFIPCAIDDRFQNDVDAKVLPSASSKIVLGDGSYNSIEANDKLWVNSIQTQVNTQMPVLCVGFSCTDPNFRRLFASIRKTSSSFPIYALLNATEYRDELAALLSIKSQDVTDAMAISYLQIVEEYYSSQYEIKIVWATDFQAMPHIIDSIALGV